MRIKNSSKAYWGTGGGMEERNWVGGGEKRPSMASEAGSGFKCGSCSMHRA